MIVDPRTPEMAAAYDEAIAKRRRAKFWKVIESEPKTAPKRSPAAIVQLWSRATQSRR